MADSRLRKLPLQLVFVTLSCSQLVNKPSLQEVQSKPKEREFPDYLKWMKFNIISRTWNFETTSIKWNFRTGEKDEILNHFKELEIQYISRN